MSISIEHTSDGDKLRRDDGKLVGSLGKGKDNLPTSNPIQKKLTTINLEDALDQYYQGNYVKLTRKPDPLTIKTIEDLISYIVYDMSWLPAGNKSEDWKWSRKNIMESINKWSLTDPQDWSNDSWYESASSLDPAFRYEENLNLATTPEKVNALRKLGYEHYLAQPLPIFVFGTLRPGQRNFEVIREEGAIEGIREGKVNGVVMLTHEKFNVPQSMEVSDESQYILGDMIMLSKDSRGEETRRNLDRLEGFNSDSPSDMSSYRRVDKMVKVTNDTGEEELVKAWVYISVLVEPADPQRIFKEGDWLKHPSSIANTDSRASDLDPKNWITSIQES